MNWKPACVDPACVDQIYEAILKASYCIVVLILDLGVTVQYIY